MTSCSRTGRIKGAWLRSAHSSVCMRDCVLLNVVRCLDCLDSRLLLAVQLDAVYVVYAVQQDTDYCCCNEPVSVSAVKSVTTEQFLCAVPQHQRVCLQATELQRCAQAATQDKCHAATQHHLSLVQELRTAQDATVPPTTAACVADSSHDCSERSHWSSGKNRHPMHRQATGYPARGFELGQPLPEVRTAEAAPPQPGLRCCDINSCANSGIHARKAARRLRTQTGRILGANCWLALPLACAAGHGQCGAESRHF